MRSGLLIFSFLNFYPEEDGNHSKLNKLQHAKETELVSVLKEGLLYFFHDTWMGIFALRETWVRIILFFPWFVNLYFPVLGKLIFDFFRYPWNMHVLSHDFWTNDFCGKEDWELITVTATWRALNLQSWTRFLTQICPVGDFANTSDASSISPS